jgi:hypothetical protein
MKRLLSLVAVMAVAATVLPNNGIAGLRGAFDPITSGTALDGIAYTNGLTNGIQTPALRPAPFGANGGVARVERWLAFTSRSLVVGQETSREIWQGWNTSQSGFSAAVITDARSPLLRDPSGVVSYTDPAWSPNARFLAYVQTNAQVTESAIYVQEYMVSTSMSTSITPVGSPILVVPMVAGVRNRHPDWSPDGNSLAYDSDASATSVDVYTVQVFPAVGTPVQHTFVNSRAEQNPAWAPDGVRIAYDTNKFGPNVIEIVDVNTHALTLAETNFKAVSHSNPDWSSNGASIYYEAPQNEDAQSNPDIWKIDLATQAKCDVLFDGNGDVNVSVSSLVNNTIDGLPYNQFLFESQAAGFGLIVWRANPIQPCVPPLTIGIAIAPATFNAGAQGNNPVDVTISMPAETRAAGYQALSFNGPREGLRMRTTIIPSPTLMGLVPPNDPALGSPFPKFVDDVNHEDITVSWTRRQISSRLTALGLTDQNVPVEVRAYSNITGRTFRGFGFINVTTGGNNAVRLEQNSPNPFNPVTKIRFANSKAGNVSLRVFNARGELVKTIVEQRMEAGLHEASWDGKNASGKHVASGVYYAKIASEGSTDVIKMVMAK